MCVYACTGTHALCIDVYVPVIQSFTKVKKYACVNPEKIRRNACDRFSYLDRATLSLRDPVNRNFQRELSGTLNSCTIRTNKGVS